VFSGVECCVDESAREQQIELHLKRKPQGPSALKMPGSKEQFGRQESAKALARELRKANLVVPKLKGDEANRGALKAFILAKTSYTQWQIVNIT